ncbi:MAG TPA: HAD hydrolase-like protein [Bryobacteraceae bacterium]|jgi:HAD superfamily phosphatase
MVNGKVKDLLIFDMDGVLVEVTESYRETIQQTVAHFTGQRPTRESIQDWKNQGGWNDDWALSTAMIKEAGVDVPYAEVVDYFQKLFHGDGTNGLVLRERWIAQPGLFDRLSEAATCAVFTGRLRWEAEYTLKRFAHQTFFAPIVGVDDVTHPKPHPEGLLKIREMVPHKRVWYAGDTVDDARSAKAAGIPFIGVASPSALKRSELLALFESEGAVSVVGDINEIRL